MNNLVCKKNGMKEKKQFILFKERNLFQFQWINMILNALVDVKDDEIISSDYTARDKFKELDDKLY